MDDNGNSKVWSVKHVRYAWFFQSALNCSSGYLLVLSFLPCLYCLKDKQPPIRKGNFHYPRHPATCMYAVLCCPCIAQIHRGFKAEGGSSSSAGQFALLHRFFLSSNTHPSLHPSSSQFHARTSFRRFPPAARSAPKLSLCRHDSVPCIHQPRFPSAPLHFAALPAP